MVGLCGGGHSGTAGPPDGRGPEQRDERGPEQMAGRQAGADPGQEEGGEGEEGDGEGREEGIGGADAAGAGHRPQLVQDQIGGSGGGRGGGEVGGECGEPAMGLVGPVAPGAGGVLADGGRQVEGQEVVADGAGGGEGVQVVGVAEIGAGAGVTFLVGGGGQVEPPGVLRARARELPGARSRVPSTVTQRSRLVLRAVR